MSITHAVDFEDGRVWAVGAGAIYPWPKEYGRNICICVPIDGIDGLSPSDIGQRVLVLVPYALGAELDDCAYHILRAGGDEEGSIRGAPDGYLERFADVFDGTPPEHRSDEATRAYNLAANEIQRRADRRAEKAAKEARRAERETKRREATHAELMRIDLGKMYHKALVALGRRDGFACKGCGGAGPDLQIDHVVPIVRGGTNEPDNLQLLCQSCNASKGAKAMDEWLGATS